MRIIKYNWLAALLGLAILVLLGFLWNLTRKQSIEAADVRAAWQAIIDFDRTRADLSSLDTSNLISYLHIIQGAKLAPQNPDLARILQREKQKLIHEIIDALKQRTGEDLGYDPEPWIKKYSQQ